MGTSSSLFNQFILQINTTSLSSTIKSLLTSILQDLSNDDNDIAVYKPNPFKDSDVAGSKSIASNDTLYLCDGGEDLQNIPFIHYYKNNVKLMLFSLMIIRLIQTNIGLMVPLW